MADYPGFQTNIWYHNTDDNKDEPSSGYPVIDAPPPYQDEPELQNNKSKSAADLPDEPQYTQTKTAEVMSEPPSQVILRASSRNIPNDHMCFSIFTMLLCCLPFGIIALLKSHEVRARIAGEDWVMAEKMSKSTWNWNVASVILGVIMYLISIIIMVCFYTVGPGSGVSPGVGGGGGGGGGGGNDDYSDWLG